MDSNSDDSQRLFRRRDTPNNLLLDDWNGSSSHHSSKNGSSNGNSNHSIAVTITKKLSNSAAAITPTNNNNNNNINDSSKRKKSKTPRSSSDYYSHRSTSSLRSNHRSSSSSTTTTWMTGILVMFVITAAVVGVLEWMYLDQMPMSMSVPSSLAGFHFSPHLGRVGGGGNSMFMLERQQQRLAPKVQLLIQEQRQQLPNLEEDFDTNYERDPDKEPILKILRQAGVDTDDIGKSAYEQLPTWSQVQRLFGPKPQIYGLGDDDDSENGGDTDKYCAAFRNNTDPTIRFFGIAGMFNSGTNLLAQLMSQNCQITERMLVYGEKSKGVRWQVPWGKHTPAKYRMEHLTRTDKDVPVSNSLPLITIRDPYQWMQSMCRHPYTVRGMHDEPTCPHIIRSSYYSRGDGHTPLIREDLNSIDVYYSNVIVRHATLIHFWNDWYQQYVMQADYPRILVRYEDLLFYAEEVTTTLCKCGGGVPRYDKFYHVQNSAKVGHMAHGHVKTNLMEAMMLYGNHEHRIDHMTPLDVQVARQLLDPNLMTIFAYHHPNMNNHMAAKSTGNETASESQQQQQDQEQQQEQQQ